MKYQIEYLKHVLKEADFVLRESKEITLDAFQKNETLKRAIVRSLEIIGEAVKHLSPEFKQKYPQVNWRQIAGLRDKLIHDYMGVDYELVWDIVKNKIPGLHQEITIMIKEEKKILNKKL